MLICSSCNIPLCRIEYEGVTICTCPDCHGALVEAMRLRAIERKHEETWAPGEAAALEAEATSRPPREQPLPCPRCLADMQETAVQVGDGTIRLDFCKACDVIWFDRGELETAQIVLEREESERARQGEEPVRRSILTQLPRKEKMKPVPSTRYRAPPAPPQSYATDDLGWAGPVVKVLIALGVPIPPYRPGP